jgi:hypothetical protein
MDWHRVDEQLRLAGWHLDAAANASAAERVREQVQCARDAYAGAMSALEHDGLDSRQQRELRERLQVLGLRLYAIERRWS